MEFIAKVKCQYGKCLYQKGEKLRQVVGEITDINPPPDYFERIESGVPVVAKHEEPEPDKDPDELTPLKAKLDEMKIPYDKRWGVAKLKQTLIEAQRGL